jgi:hypothetical protein
MRQLRKSAETRLRRSMTAVAVALISAPLLIAALPSPAGAIKRCPPLIVSNNSILCLATNYGTSADTNVTLTLYDSIGTPVETCGPQSISPKAPAGCLHTVSGAELVSCVVTGEGSLTRVSLSTLLSSSNLNSAAAVECR